VTAIVLAGAVMELHALPLPGGEGMHAGGGTVASGDIAASWGGGEVASVSSPVAIASWPPELPPEVLLELPLELLPELLLPLPPSWGPSRMLGFAPEQATMTRATAPTNAPRIPRSVAPGPEHSHPARGPSPVVVGSERTGGALRGAPPRGRRFAPSPPRGPHRAPTPW
jgi:hypothetical protein